MILLNTFTNILIILSVLSAIATIGVFSYFVPIALWIKAISSGVGVSVTQLIRMRLRSIPPSIIIDAMIKGTQGGVKSLTIEKLEKHYMTKGNVPSLIDSLVGARSANIQLTFEQAAAIDLAGRDIFKIVKQAIDTKVIEVPRVKALARDGIELEVHAKVTVLPNVTDLLKKAGEKTIIARVGEGVVGAVGSEPHHTIHEHPDIISNKLDKAKLGEGTAYTVISVDIADIDVGRNIGAQHKAEDAEAKLKVARAKAEKDRADAVASEQRYRAEVQRMRAALIQAQAAVPLAMAEALKAGKISVAQYHKLKNIEADTKMRESFSNMEDRIEDETPK